MGLTCHPYPSVSSHALQLHAPLECCRALFRIHLTALTTIIQNIFDWDLLRPIWAFGTFHLFDVYALLFSYKRRLIFLIISLWCQDTLSQIHHYIGKKGICTYSVTLPSCETSIIPNISAVILGSKCPSLLFLLRNSCSSSTETRPSWFMSIISNSFYRRANDASYSLCFSIWAFAVFMFVNLSLNIAFIDEGSAALLLVIYPGPIDYLDMPPPSARDAPRD